MEQRPNKMELEEVRKTTFIPLLNRTKPYYLPKQFRREEQLRQRDYLVEQNWCQRLGGIVRSCINARTPMEWIRILLFFLLFYAGLVCFWKILFRIFYTTINFKRPMYLLSQPGFSMQPCVFNYHLDICYVQYEVDDNAEINTNVQLMQKYMYKFGSNINRTAFGPCTVENEFGFRELKPCVLLKVNRVIGFKVDPITDVEDMPVSAPESLKEYMVEFDDIDGPNGRVWISCNTTDEFDFIIMTFYPYPYIDAKYIELDESIWHDHSAYAALNQQNDNDADFNRIVAMQITNPPLNTKIRFQCQLWAKNIVQLNMGAMSRGVVSFELLINSN